MRYLIVFLFMLFCSPSYASWTTTNMGIGTTTTPSATTLRVTSASTVRTDQAIYIDNTIYSSKTTILQNGNVGIGTLLPVKKLHIDGTIYWVNGDTGAHGAGKIACVGADNAIYTISSGTCF